MIDETAMIWLQLRERRGSIHARSALLKDSASRRKTFAVAMQQFEEQMTAAKVVTPATSPINLYYGLTQAGMAIAAASAPGQWTVRSHGLKLEDTQPDLPGICVQPSGTGAFQAVASATSSPGIIGPASIGSLWQSLPDLSESVPLPGAQCPAALPVIPEIPPAFDASGSGFPTRVLFFQPPGATVSVQADLPDRADREAWCSELLKQYPTSTGWNPDAPTKWFTDENGNSTIFLRVPGPVKKYPLPSAEAEPLYDKLAPEYRYHQNRYMRPSIQGAGEPPPSPLMTWWLLLYGFSMLARYQPRKWTDLLNLDKPGCATHLQYALETARSAIPHLMLEALDGHPILISETLSFRYERQSSHD
jgi:hypothetical protein